MFVAIYSFVRMIQITVEKKEKEKDRKQIASLTVFVHCSMNF